MSKTKRRRIKRDPQIQKRHRERFLAALANGSHAGRPSVTEKNCTRRRNELIAKGAMNTGE